MSLLVRFTQAIAAGSLGTMVLIVALDVFLRYAFNRPMAASIELVELGIVGAIFMALPAASARGIHIGIDYLDDVLPERAIAILDRISNLLIAASLFALAFVLIKRGIFLMTSGETSATLKLPAGVPAFFMAFALAATGLVHGARALNPFSPRKSTP